MTQHWASGTATTPGAVLFDLDGTLIDSVPDITLAVAELMQAESLAPFGEAAVRSMVGHGVRKLVERAYAAHGIELDDAELDTKTGLMMNIYPRHLVGHTRLMSGAAEALDFFVGSPTALAVVTNKPLTATQTILEHFGIAGRFSFVLGDGPLLGSEGLARKPAPDMLLYALSRLGVPPGGAVMVGDSSADILSAAAAGVFSIGVRGGYINAPIESYEPDLVIDSLADLPSALAERYVSV